MLTKRRIFLYHTLASGLLASLFIGLFAGITPAFGQQTDTLDAMTAMMERLYPQRVNDDFRIGAWVGTCFHSRQSHEHCHVIQADFRYMVSPSGKDHSKRRGFVSGFLLPLMDEFDAGEAGAGIQGTAAYGPDDNWPDPSPPIDPPPGPSKVAHDSLDTQIEADHNGTFTGTVELLLVIPLQRKFLIEPFVGLGVARIFEGDNLSLTTVGIQKKTMLAASYGVGLTIRAHDNVDVRFQFRGSIYRTGSLTYMVQDGREIERNVGTVSNSSLLFGLGFRLPR